MKHSILTALNCVFDYLLHFAQNDNKELAIDQEDITHYLKSEGFDNQKIEQTLAWLFNFNERDEDYSYHKNSVRIYTDEEQSRIGVEALNLLYMLQRYHVLSPPEHELVVSQTLSLEQDKIDVETIKLITTIVLSNSDDDQKLEHCLLLQQPETGTQH